MKKLMAILVCMIIGLVCLPLYANEPFAITATYSIVAVTGNVQVDTPVGPVALYTNETLKSTEVIYTAANSSLTLTDALGTVYKIGSRKSGLVSKLLAELGKKQKITIGAKVVESTVTTESTQSRTNISTAATRASDATKDLDWSE